MACEPFHHIRRAGGDSGSRDADIHLPGGHFLKTGEPYLFRFLLRRYGRPLEVALCPVVRFPHCGGRQHGTLHAERGENSLLDQVLKTDSGDLLCDNADEVVDCIAVLRFIAEGFIRLKKTDAAQIFLSCDGSIRPHGVVPGNPCAVAEHVAERALPGRCRIIELELRKVFMHRAVIVQNSFINKRSNYGRTEGLGAGGNSSERIPRHRQFLPNIPVSKSVCLNRLSTLAYTKRDARDIPPLKLPVYKLVCQNFLFHAVPPSMSVSDCSLTVF